MNIITLLFNLLPSNVNPSLSVALSNLTKKQPLAHPVSLGQIGIHYKTM